MFKEVNGEVVIAFSNKELEEISTVNEELDESELDVEIVAILLLTGRTSGGGWMEVAEESVLVGTVIVLELELEVIDEEELDEARIGEEALAGDA